mgnify:CR=1 FL=1
MQQIKQFSIIGISIRTTNENQQAASDITALWNKFMTEGILEQIPNKTDQMIYCVYTDYEKDHTKPYTTILGCKVESLDSIPEGMVGKRIDTANYELFTPKGNLMQGLVYNEWLKIWDLNLPRAFTSDFEVYGPKAQNFENAEVDIFIAVK